MKRKGWIKIVLCVLVVLTFVAADIAVMPLINPKDAETQAAVK